MTFKLLEEAVVGGWTQEASASRVFGGAMLVGPGLLVASFARFVVSDGGLNADELGGALLVWAFVGLMVSAVGVLRSVEIAFPRAAPLLLVLAAVGCAGGVGFGIDSIHAGVPGGIALEDVDSAAAGVALFVPGIVFPLSFVGIGLAQWRAGIGPMGSGPMLAMAAVLFPLGNIGDVEPIAVASAVGFALALVPLGVQWLRHGAPAPEALLSRTATL